MEKKKQPTKKKKKKGLHRRNKHSGRYDFKKLTAAFPLLKDFVFINEHEIETVDFTKPDAVRALNKALLVHHYGLRNWKIPEGYLCPPVPGRVDYLHYLADQMAKTRKGKVPRGENVKVFEIGVGANCIYPLVGHKEYGWHFVGSEIDKVALQAAKENVYNNRFPEGAVELRLQENSEHIFYDVIHSAERFEACMCNPPFHGSSAEAKSASRRKWKNLGIEDSNSKNPERNFGGKQNELWCKGGEMGFISRLIQESRKFPKTFKFFSTLVSQKKNVPKIIRELKTVRAREIEVIEMAAGQKTSRMICWKFDTEPVVKTFL